VYAGGGLSRAAVAPAEEEELPFEVS